MSAGVRSKRSREAFSRRSEHRDRLRAVDVAERHVADRGRVRCTGHNLCRAGNGYQAVRGGFGP